MVANPQQALAPTISTEVRSALLPDQEDRYGTIDEAMRDYITGVLQSSKASRRFVLEDILDWLNLQESKRRLDNRLNGLFDSALTLSKTQSAKEVC